MINSKKGILLFVGIESIILTAFSTFLTIVYADSSKNLFLLVKNNSIFILVMFMIVFILYLQINSVMAEPDKENINNDHRLTVAGFLVLVITSFTILFYVYQRNQSIFPTMAQELNETTNEMNTSSIAELTKDYKYAKEYITFETLKSLNEKEIGLIRNEIYARNGYIFKDEIINNYFEEKDWYKPNSSYSYDLLNDVEKGNLVIITSYEKSNGYSNDFTSYDEDYATTSNADNTYNCPEDYKYDKEYIKESFLKSLTKEGVEILRNEIFARHGYIFKNPKLSYYFSAQSWYKEDPNYNDNMLNEIEVANIQIIVNHEKKMGWN